MLQHFSFPETFSLNIAFSVQKIPSSHSGLLIDDFTIRISLNKEAIINKGAVELSGCRFTKKKIMKKFKKKTRARAVCNQARHTSV